MAVSCGRASAKRGLSNMKSVVSIRHLLAGSSFVALLAASNAALGASIVNLGSTSHLQVTTPVDTVVNLGTVANSAGLPGIGVSGETVSGPIINDGVIDIDGDLSAVGILVEGTSGVGAAAVGAGIINDDDGQITVRADNTSGDAMARAASLSWAAPSPWVATFSIMALSTCGRRRSMAQAEARQPM